jgi:GGDEF domain-containing protein
MKQIRFRVVVLVCWLILFYSFGRLIDPLDITAVASTMMLIVAVLTLIAPGLARGPVGAVLAIAILLFLILEAAAGVGVLGMDTLSTIAEVCAIVITVLLSRWVSLAVSEFESAIAHITIGRKGQAPEPPVPGSGSIYREIRRARNYERPLALMAIAVEEKSVQVVLDRMVQEAQLTMMKQYALSGVSRVLCEELEDCNVVVQSNGHFLIGLPEVTPEQLPALMERLRQLVSEQVGVSLRIGAASLPQDGLTFEGLQDKAIKDMESPLDRQPPVRLQLSYVERHSV